jgi:hypothetical protein
VVSQPVLVKGGELCESEGDSAILIEHAVGLVVVEVLLGGHLMSGEKGYVRVLQLHE